MAISFSQLLKNNGGDKASAYLKTYVSAVQNGGNTQTVALLKSIGVPVTGTRGREDTAAAFAALDASPALTAALYSKIGLSTPESRSAFASKTTTPASGTTPASRATNPSQQLGYDPATGKVNDNVQVSANQVRALQSAGEQVPQYATDALAGKNANGVQVQAPRTLASVGSPASTSQPTITGIKRVGGDFSAVLSDGSEQHIDQTQFQNLGINETFVPQGSTVSLQQATQGNTDSGAGNPVKITQEVLNGMHEAGYMINPNVEITPAKAAEFLALAQKNINVFLPQAQKEIAPYYASQLKLAKDQFLASLGYSTDEIAKQEQDLERKYGQDVRTLGENAAEQGFAQSGLRQRDERTLATDTQNTIDVNRRNLSYNAGNSARTFAQNFGSDALPTANISNAPRVLAGAGTFERQAGTRPLYQLSDSVYSGLTGSQQYQERAQEAARASELEGAYRSFTATPQPRTLT